MPKSKQPIGQTAKGTVSEVARLAGIMAAKNTSQLIPLCHPMMLERCKLALNYEDDEHRLHIQAEVAVSHKTGGGNGALTAVSVAGTHRLRYDQGTQSRYPYRANPPGSQVRRQT